MGQPPGSTHLLVTNKYILERDVAISIELSNGGQSLSNWAGIAS